MSDLLYDGLGDLPVSRQSKPRAQPKNIVRCEVCQRDVLRRRLEIHPLTPDCQLTVVARRMRADGFVRSSGYGNSLKQAGFIVRMAPVSYVLEVGHPLLNAEGFSVRSYISDRGKKIVYGLVDGLWVNKDDLRAAKLLGNMTVDRDLRWKLVRRLVVDAELFKAIEVLKASGKKVVPREWYPGSAKLLEKRR